MERIDAFRIDLMCTNLYVLRLTDQHIKTTGLVFYIEMRILLLHPLRKSRSDSPYFSNLISREAGMHVTRHATITPSSTALPATVSQEAG
jgi:hypothetical protein